MSKGQRFDGRPSARVLGNFFKSAFEMTKITIQIHVKYQRKAKPQVAETAYDERQSNYDALRETILESRGFTVRRIKRHQLYDPLASDNFATTIGSFLGIRKRPVTLKHQYARERLRSELFPG